MRIKKLLFNALFLLVNGLIVLHAQTMFVDETDGSQTPFAINNIRKLTFSGDNLHVNQKVGGEESYSFPNIQKLTFNTYEGPCINENLSAPSGTISDNSGSGDYANNMDCYKLIDASGNENIELTFSSFDLEDNYDFVTIYDGSTTSSTEIGRYTGNSNPGTIIATSGNMLIHFTTDHSVTEAGWEASYIMVIDNGACIDETFNDENGTITDNSGDDDYRNNSDCKKYIQSSSGTQISLTFNSFDLEENYDYVRIYDGFTTSATLLEELTGNSMPGTITSSSNEMLIHFITDHSVTKAGWEANYTSSDGGNGPCLDETFSENIGTVSDNSGEENYSNNSDCKKYFQTSSGTRISLTFNSFDIEEDYDYVYVYDGLTTSATLLGMFTGNSNPGTIISSSNEMLIHFTTDHSVVEAGWEASYIASDEYIGPCIDETFTDENEIITDNSAGGDYFNDMDCKKYIQTSPRTQITLSFSEFNVEENYDYVYIYDGLTTSATILGTFTGNSNPGTIISSSNEMLIHFTTDYSVVTDGWVANYSTTPIPPIAHNPEKPEEVTGIEDENIEDQFKLYPNPVNDELNILFNSSRNKKIQITILSLDGKIILEDIFYSSIGNTLWQVNVESLNKGMYICQINTGETIKTIKFLKK